MPFTKEELKILSKSPVCKWVKKDNILAMPSGNKVVDGFWSTSCGTEDYWGSAVFKFCPYCGKTLDLNII